MTDKYLGLFSGRAGSEAIVRNVIVDEATYVGDPVILVAAATGERDARVEPNDTQGAQAVGIIVDGDQKGQYVDGARGSDELAANAGEAAKLVTKGRCKARVDGSTANISVGDKLTMDGVDGQLEKADTGDNVCATALQASTAWQDLILIDVNPEGVL